MTSKYKFRGKSLKTGEWVYGSLLQINGDAYIYTGSAGNFHICPLLVSWESVGQYTGLNDEYGVQINEADVI